MAVQFHSLVFRQILQSEATSLLIVRFFGCRFIAMDYCHELILINWYYLHSAFNGAVPYRYLFLFLLSWTTHAVGAD